MLRRRRRVALLCDSRAIVCARIHSASHTYIQTTRQRLGSRSKSIQVRATAFVRPHTNTHTHTRTMVVHSLSAHAEDVGARGDKEVDVFVCALAH